MNVVHKKAIVREHYHTIDIYAYTSWHKGDSTMKYVDHFVEMLFICYNV